MAANPQAPEYKEGVDQRPEVSNRPIVPATQARAGVTGHNVRYVLAAGLAAVIVAFVIVYLAYV
jgi:hypothetical protein